MSNYFKRIILNLLHQCSTAKDVTDRCTHLKFSIDTKLLIPPYCHLYQLMMKFISFFIVIKNNL